MDKDEYGCGEFRESAIGLASLSRGVWLRAVAVGAWAVTQVGVIRHSPWAPRPLVGPARLHEGKGKGTGTSKELQASAYDTARTQTQPGS